MRVLYVEDDPFDADLTRRELAKSAPQIELDIVTTVREACRRLEDVSEDVAERYDLALIDLKLPDGDGMEVLKAIRERGLPLAVVIVTGRGDEDVAVQALKLGAADYVVKHRDYMTHLPLILEDAFRRFQTRASRRAQPLRVLYAEHSATDIDLTERHLARHARHIELEVAQSGAQALQRLSTTPESWDVMLLDYNLPGMNALELLKEMRQRRGLDVPVVLVTGRGDEEVAVQALKLGAADYVVKSAGYLFRLPAVLEDAFHRAELARERAALRESEDRYRSIFNGVQDAIFVESLSGEILDVNDRACEMFGYTRDELLAKTVNDLVPSGELVLIPDEWARGEMPTEPLDRVNVRASGERFPVEITGQLQTIGDQTVLLIVARDITERKRAERALRESEALNRAIIESSRDCIKLLDLDGNLQFMSAGGQELLEIEDIDPFLNESWIDFWEGEGREHAASAIETALEGGTGYFEAHCPTVKGTPKWWGVMVSPILGVDRDIGELLAVSRDITERRRAEGLLKALNKAALATEKALTPQEVFDAVAEELGKVGFSCAVYLTNEAQTKLFPKYLTYRSSAIKAAERLAGLPLEGFYIPVERADAYREVVQEKKTVFVEDTDRLVQQLLPRPIKRFASQIVRIVGIRQAIDAPLVVEDEVIGILAVQSDDLTAADVPAITAFAHQVAAAWRKAQLLEQAQDLTTKLKAIARPARQMSALLDQDEIMPQVLQSLQEVTGCYNANLFLREGDEVVLAAGHGGYEDGEPPVGHRLSLGQGIIGRVARSRRPALVPDVSRDPGYMLWEELPDTCSELAVPVMRGDRLLGVMDMQSRERNAFDATDLEALGVLADQLAVALDNARLFAETRRLKQFNEGIVQSMAEGILIEDADGHITFANPMTAELLGYHPEQLLGRPVSSVIPAQHCRRDDGAPQRDQDVVNHYETDLLRKDGHSIPVLVSARPLFEDRRFSGVISVFTDITERKRAEEALRRHTARLEALHTIDQAILEAESPESIAQAALQHVQRLVPCTAAAAATFNPQAQEATLFALHPEAAFGLEAGTSLPLQVGAVELELLRQSGVFVEQDVTAVSEPLPTVQSLRDIGLRSYVGAPLIARGELIGVLGLGSESPNAFTSDDADIVREVADQMAVALHQTRLSAALEAERRRLETTMEHVPEGILLLDAERCILLANRRAKDDLALLVGAPAGSGRPDVSGRSPREGDRLDRLGNRPLEELLVSPPPGRRHELGADGRTFEIVARPVGDEGGEVDGWVLVFDDVTAQRQREEQVQRQERLAALGQLAGGIAHDFRNFLSSILLYADMALRHPNLPPTLASFMEIIVGESKQASGLVQQILDFSRRSRMKTQPLDLKPFVREAVRVLEHTIPENISVLDETGPGRHIVEADPTRIQQVLMNLALNARDAMPEGGDLRISLTRNTMAPDEKPPVVDMAPGDWICLAVSDTGVGMTEEVQAHLFEPFFTTKGPGMGTGLGLAQVHGIVDQHRGHITVETAVDVGTTFRVYLPAHSGEGLDEIRVDVRGMPRGHGETILLVEDEDQVRNAMRRLLMSLDYHVVAAANGREALELCRSERPALVITDLVMPEMGGRELVQALHERYPELKTLVVTGYAVDGDEDDVGAGGVTAVVEKPFEPRELAQAIRRVLEQTTRV